MKSIISSVKGTRDFYPPEMAVRSFLYGLVRKVSESYGYQEWDGPFLERLELYAAKSGEELVKQQSYVFEDRGGDLITLRPELTPTLSRMVAQKQNDLAFPLRWWSFGPFWRYERPQKGRSREFFQWNIDMLGINTPESDAELVATAATFLQTAGFNDQQVEILVNNRKLMEGELAGLGITGELRKAAFHMIDRRDKLPPAAWEEYVLENGLTPAQLDGLKATLENKDLWKKLPEFVRFFDALDGMGLRKFVRFDPQVIRGLDYYTGIVFEGRDRDGGRAILGGGRYDNLVSDVGGEQMPAVGFAMGDVMVSLTLEKYGLLPKTTSVTDTVLVTVFDPASLASSFAFGSELRNAGLKVICYPDAVKLQKQLKFADRMGIHCAVILGPDEAAAGRVTLKDLRKGVQETVARGQAAEKLRQMLADV